MPRRQPTETSDAGSSQDAPPSINDDARSSAETITPPDTLATWKARCEALDRETDRLYEVNQRRDNEIKELKDRLQAREVTPSVSTYSERSRSQKIPDPPLFTDGKDPTWENWYGKIQDKLEINADLFPNERAKLGYVHSRLSGDAAEATQSRRERGCANPYQTTDELLEELAQLFDDPDKEANFRREYYNLVQGSKKFSEFYTQFQRLSSYLGYHEKQLIADLKDKINPRLRSVWVGQLVQPGSLKEIRSYLIRLDNDQRAIREIKDKIKRVDNPSRTTFPKATVVTQPVDHPKPDHLKPRGAVLTSVKEADVLAGTCFICHKSGHSSKECSDRPTRINAVDKEYDRSDSDSDSDSDANSKN
jgi:hypothetical protein